MKRINKTIVICLISIVFCLAQTPDWVKNGGKSNQYPQSRYVTGLGAGKVTKQSDKLTAEQIAVESAKRNLSEKISVSISSKVSSVKEENRSQYSEYFSAATQSSSSITLEGLQVLQYYDDDKEMCYAFVSASRQAISQSYKKEADALREEIKTHLNAAGRYVQNNERSKALAEYLACYTLFEKLKSDESIIAGVQTEMDKTFTELDGTIKKDEVSIAEVRDEVNKIVERPIASLDDAAWRLLYTLKPQTGADIKRVAVLPFMYQETRFSSPFARYMAKLIESKMGEVASWEPAEITKQTDDIAQATQQAPVILIGSYWEQTAGLKILAVLKRVSDGAVIAGTEAIIPKQTVDDSKLDRKPQNFKEALSDQKQFRKEEVLGGGLMVDVWTDKGQDNIVFAKGERTHIYIRVNMPCYVRLLYHLASKQRALLMDNYYIDDSKVNLVYQLPQEFEVDAPYGVEVIQVSVQTEKFNPIRTRNVDGYDILEDDLGKVLTQTRGLKKIKQGVFKAETRLTVTTMEK
jgi:hypothetical protein